MEKSPIIPTKETYDEATVKAGDSVETRAVQILSIIDNPSNEVIDYLKNQPGKVRATVVRVEKKTDTKKFERDVEGDKYIENVTFDSVTVEIEGLSTELPIKINATIFETLAKKH